MEKIWQEFYAKGVPFSIDFDEVTLPEALKRTAKKLPDRDALIFQGNNITFRELNELVCQFASALKELGVQKGDRVSIILPNLIQTVVAVYGTMTAGATAAMHNPRAGELNLAHQLNDAGSRILVCLDLLVPKMVAARKRTQVQKILSCHIRDYLPLASKMLFSLVKREMHLDTPREQDVFEFKELLESGKTKFQGPPVSLDDTAFILYTSATTGPSKGVVLSQRNMSVNLQQARSWFPAFEDGKETVVGCLPFFHVFGITCALNIGIFYGFTDVLVPLPEPKNILEAMSSGKASFIPALPTLYNAVANESAFQKYNFKSLKGCFSGGAPLPASTIRTFENLTGTAICEGYGLTETSPVTHVNPHGGITKPGSIGLPLPGTDAKIVDVDDPHKEITSPDVPGELCIQGPQVMQGYLNLPEVTGAAFLHGWFHTGDIVTRDRHGYFFVVDRRNDIIGSGDLKVYPRHVEEVLFAHPKVEEAAVIAIRSSGSAEAVKGVVVPKKGERPTEKEIIEFCARRLSPHQVPQEIQFQERLPRTPIGKVQRGELKRLHLIKKSKVPKQ